MYPSILDDVANHYNLVWMEECCAILNSYDLDGDGCLNKNVSTSIFSLCLLLTERPGNKRLRSRPSARNTGSGLWPRKGSWIWDDSLCTYTHTTASLLLGHTRPWYDTLLFYLKLKTYRQNKNQGLSHSAHHFKTTRYCLFKAPPLEQKEAIEEHVLLASHRTYLTDLQEFECQQEQSSLPRRTPRIQAWSHQCLHHASLRRNTRIRHHGMTPSYLLFFLPWWY